MENNAALKSMPDMIVQSGQDYIQMHRDMIQLSCLYEGAKKQIRELQQENSKLEGIVTIMASYLFDSLELFEHLFECDESFCDVSRMSEYVTIARYMEKRTGRKNIADRVEAKINELPFN